MKKLLLAALLAAVPAGAEEPTFDAKAVLKEAQAQAAEAESIEPSQVGMTRRYDSDCVTFSFGPDDQPRSEAVWLRSTEWVEECTWTGDPRHGGGRQCWERPGYTYNERVQVTLQDRKTLYPWERDSFRVCLSGPWLDVDQLATAYDYKMVGGGNRDGNIVLTPGNKRQMKPDAAGITAQLKGDLTLALHDKWASYYAGEKVVLKVTLMREVDNWFDPTLLTKELEYGAVPGAIDLKQFSGEFSEGLKAGKRYYVKLEFKRVGVISKPDYVKSGETPAVPYQPSLLAALF